MKSARKRRKSVVLSAIISLLAFFIVVPESAHAVTTVQSRGVYIDASGRAGGQIVVTVISKLANGATSTTDGAYAYVYSGQGTVSTNSSNFASVSAPYKVENSIAYYRLVLSAGSLSGNYSVYAGVSGDYLANYSDISGASTRVAYAGFTVGGFPSIVKFSSNNLRIKTSTGTDSSSLTPYFVALLDGNGNRTILMPNETVTISVDSFPSSSTVTLKKDTSGTISTSSTFNSLDYRGDGILRGYLGINLVGTSVIRGTFTSSLVPGFFLDNRMSITTSQSYTVTQTAKIGSYANSDRNFALGTNGKLHTWGSGSIGMNDGVSGIDFNAVTYVKPTMIDFPKAANSENFNYIKSFTTHPLGVIALADDGTLWATGARSGISFEQALAKNLQPIFTPVGGSHEIVSMTANAKMLLLDTGYVLIDSGSTSATAYLKTYTTADLSSIGNPVVTQIGYIGSGAFLYLVDSRTVYSSGTNTYGELGQGSDTATSLGLVSLPVGRYVSNIYAGSGFGVLKMTDGTYWTWGDNQTGQQAKSQLDVPYSNTPRILVLPTGVTVKNLKIEDRITIWNDTEFYVSYSAGWFKSFLNSYSSYSGSIQDVSVNGVAYTSSGSFYYYHRYLNILDSDNRMFQSGYPTGSCSASGYRVRSDGQFGEKWFVDPVTVGSKFYIDSTTTTSISNIVSTYVNTAFSIQAANVRTNCYQTTDLRFAWDKDGNGSFETPDTPTVGDTGYLGLNASFNYSSAGRRTVSLGVTTPDSVTLTVPFTIGVELSNRVDLTAIDTSTTQIVSGNDFSVALTANGKVYGWGRNSYQQLGISSSVTTMRNFPTEIVMPDTITPKSLSTPYDGNYQFGSTLIVDSQGRVWRIGRSLSSGSRTTSAIPILVNELSSLKVREIRDYLILTTDGRLFIWNQNDLSLSSIPGLAGLTIKSFEARTYQDGCSYSYSSADYYQGVAIDSDGNVWSLSVSNTYQSTTVTQLEISNAKTIKGDRYSSVIVGNSGELWYSYRPGCVFGQVSKPAGTVLSDAGTFGDSSNTLALVDTASVVWTNSINQSLGIFQPSSWVRLTTIDSVKSSSTDRAYFFNRAPNYIGLASGRIFTSSPYYVNDNATCQTSGNRIFSTGQFGSSYFQDAITTSSMMAFIGTKSGATFTSGQAFAANPGDALIFKIVNPRSSCFGGTQQLTATADLDGNGSFETTINPTNENGTYAFIASTTAPSSSKRTISFLLQTPAGTSSTITVDVGVYNSTTDSAITNRTQVIHTAYNTTFAVGSDGYGYAWGGGINFMNILTSTPPRTYLKPTKIAIPGNPQIVDGATYYSDYTGEDYGILVVDADGKVWSWATRRTIDVPASTFALGSVPVTPTQISAFSGITIKKIAIDPFGYQGMALDDKGNVYYWNDSSRTPTIVDGLAGIVAKDIFVSNSVLAILSTSNQLFTWNGSAYFLGRQSNNPSCYWCYDRTVGRVAISDQVDAVSFGMAKGNNVSTALTKTGKLYSWGQFKNGQVVIPETSTLPSNRTPVAIGSNGSYLIVVASDKTWWYQTLDVNNNIVYYQLNSVPTAIRNNFVTFSTGYGNAIRTSDSNLYTLSQNNSGTCGVVGPYSRVMSDGQFGSTFADDTIDIQIDGSDISRPNQNNTLRITANSRCFGATGVTVTAALTGGSTYSNPSSSSTSVDGSYLYSNFTYNPSSTGPLTIHIKATTSAGVTVNTDFYTLVVPLPPAGRQVGVSINNGARYTNNSNVTLNLVWPDGVYKIYVSNDGGFAPGTVTEIDLQTQISWTLAPQAVIPLPSIVYARFGDSSMYYFDDIILDAISPILTFASAQP